MMAYEVGWQEWREYPTLLESTTWRRYDKVTAPNEINWLAGALSHAGGLSRLHRGFPTAH